MRQERKEQVQLLNEIRAKNHNLIEIDEKRAKKDWVRIRSKRTEAMQIELDPLIYKYLVCMGHR